MASFLLSSSQYDGSCLKHSKDGMQVIHQQNSFLNRGNRSSARMFGIPSCPLASFPNCPRSLQHWSSTHTIRRLTVGIGSYHGTHWPILYPCLKSSVTISFLAGYKCFINGSTVLLTLLKSATGIQDGKP